MATCKDCLHFEKCATPRGSTRYYNKALEVNGDVSRLCEWFIDKTKYVNVDAIEKRLCEKCNEEFSESPCEPSECFILDILRNAKMDGDSDG